MRTNTRAQTLIQLLMVGASIGLLTSICCPLFAFGASVRPAELSAQDTPGESAYSYVGNKKCKGCHLDVHKNWAKTKMGLAFESLQPGHASESKAKFNLDDKKDYTTDPKCLTCHTTGYGKPGGYAIPDPDDRRAARKAKNLQGAGCEMCHGPGSEYVKIFEEIDKSQRQYTLEELRSAGLRKIEKRVCVTCHNEESPTIAADEPFDYDKIMKEEEQTKDDTSKIHLHKPLKLREK